MTPISPAFAPPLLQSRLRPVPSAQRIPRRARSTLAVAAARPARPVRPPRSSSPSSKTLYISRLRRALKAHSTRAEDPFWSVMQQEARVAAEGEPLLASFLFSTVLNHKSLNQALTFHLANKLASAAMPSTILMRVVQDAIRQSPRFSHHVTTDLLAVMERDPACIRFIDAFLYFKGFHALQAHRVAHLLWKQGRIPLAYHLQSQVSKELQVDIHPAAQIGTGVFLDHATGMVIGETACIGNNCSLLHHVTLGGTGKMHGDRHPKLRDGVLVGAGATLLGNVIIGEGAQIGACSLVLEDIPAHATVVGVPAKVVARQGMAVPALHMKHERCLPGCTDQTHDHEQQQNNSGNKEVEDDESKSGSLAQQVVQNKVE